jgi:hypothetical protein
MERAKCLAPEYNTAGPPDANDFLENGLDVKNEAGSTYSVFVPRRPVH